MIPPAQRYCRHCRITTWHYDGVCKLAYLHPAPEGREAVVAAAYAEVLAQLDSLAVPEALSVLSAATEHLLLSIPTWAGANWIELMRQHISKFPPIT